MLTMDEMVPAQPQSEQLDLFLNYSFHELRTPLTVVYSCAQLLSDKLPDSPEFSRLRRIVAQMLDQSEEMVAMLEEFLEASRLRAKKMQLDLSEIELGELCQQTLSHLTEAQQARIRIEEPTERMTLQGDGTRLELSLAMVLSLAVKATPTDNLVDLRLNRNDQDGFLIDILTPGLQISDEEREKLFDFNFPLQFGYSDLRAGRSGVGLFIAQGIIEAHGGSLEFDPNLPGFKIKLKADL